MALVSFTEATEEEMETPEDLGTAESIGFGYGFGYGGLRGGLYGGRAIRPLFYDRFYGPRIVRPRLNYYYGKRLLPCLGYGCY